MLESAKTTNSKHALETIEFFHALIPDLALAWVPKEIDFVNFAEQYSQFVINNIEDIVDSWAKEQTAYLNQYNVSPENLIFDEFKNLYFIGTVIAKKLEESGDVMLTKLQLIALLKLLDYRLATAPVDASRLTLTFRMQKAIDNRTITEDFGRFGWLILYKCLYNNALDFHNSTRSQSQ